MCLILLSARQEVLVLFGEENDEYSPSSIIGNLNEEKIAPMLQFPSTLKCELSSSSQTKWALMYTCASGAHC